MYFTKYDYQQFIKITRFYYLKIFKALLSFHSTKLYKMFGVRTEYHII